MEAAKSPSSTDPLNEIQTSAYTTTRFSRIFKRFLAYCGPGYMIAVGYMDPGNWATGIEAGSRYGYSLLWVILLSNLMAMVLQHLCVRLGITSQMDLAESCRERCPRWLNLMLYAFAEIAMISTDLAEVIGTAIALRLLFGLPIIAGVLVTVADVLLLLAGLGSDQTKSYRILEVLVMVLMGIIGTCFLIEMIFVKPSLTGIFWGFVPHELGLLADKDALFAAIGIIGATVMPHNLYLHSSIVKHRLGQPKESQSNDDQTDHEVIAIMPDNTDGLGKMINFATADTIVALFLALLVNAAILITSAAAFHARGQHNVQHIEEAALLMKEWMGPAASIVFGLALLAAGQSSTVTGTIAGQIVFEGFLRIRLKPWLRRLVTRVVAIAPALIIVLIMGENRINWLLLVSQVVLSFQLPFAIIPLIIFAFNPPAGSRQSPELAEYWQSRKGRLSEKLLKISSWAITVFILILNVLLVITMLM